MVKDEKQREYYRLAYPRAYRPSLIMDIENFEVEDVSEYGLKVRIDDDLAFMVDDDVQAIIAFPDGREFDLSGHVVRIGEGYAGVELETPLPLSLIRSEYLYIVNHYPSVN